MKLIKLIVVSAMLMFGAFTANAQGFGGQMDPQEMVKMRVDQMKQSFNLTDAQVKQVTEFYTKQNEEMMKIFESGSRQKAQGVFLRSRNDGLLLAQPGSS